MASFKFHLRKSKKEGSNEGRLFIRVIVARQTKEIPTQYSVKVNEWDSKHRKIVYDPIDRGRDQYLFGIETKMLSDLNRLKQIEENLARKGTYTVLDIIGGVKDYYRNSNNLVCYCDKACDQLIASGQSRTARAYRSAARSFYIYKGRVGVSFDNINSTTIRSYESYLKAEGLQKNTISFYLRNLRALYHRAIAEKMIEPQSENPFAGVNTGVYESKKRALNFTELKSFRSVEHKLENMFSGEDVRKRTVAGNLYDSLEYFNFCLEGRGISWIDMVFLKKSDIKDNMLTYRRKKTGGQLVVKITKSMRRIIDYFSSRAKDSPYIFPVLNPSKGNERRQYESSLRSQNERLGILATMAGIDKKVTTHVSRHTWATFAKNTNIPISIISELLGHRDVKTTYRYLGTIENQLLINATDQVTKALNKAA